MSDSHCVESAELMCNCVAVVCARGLLLSVCLGGNKRSGHRHQVNTCFCSSTNPTIMFFFNFLFIHLNSVAWVSGFTPAMHWSFPPSRGSSWILLSTSCTRTSKKVSFISVLQNFQKRRGGGKKKKKSFVSWADLNPHIVWVFVCVAVFSRYFVHRCINLCLSLQKRETFWTVRALGFFCSKAPVSSNHVVWCSRCAISRNRNTKQKPMVFNDSFIYLFGHVWPFQVTTAASRMQRRLSPTTISCFTSVPWVTSAQARSADTSGFTITHVGSGWTAEHPSVAQRSPLVRWFLESWNLSGLEWVCQAVRVRSPVCVAQSRSQQLCYFQSNALLWMLVKTDIFTRKKENILFSFSVFVWEMATLVTYSSKIPVGYRGSSASSRVCFLQFSGDLHQLPGLLSARPKQTQQAQNSEVSTCNPSDKSFKHGSHSYDFYLDQWNNLPGDDGQSRGRNSAGLMLLYWLAWCQHVFELHPKSQQAPERDKIFFLTITFSFTSQAWIPGGCLYHVRSS